jgi:4-hydroxybenzoate polyprenyltransferase
MTRIPRYQLDGAKTEYIVFGYLPHLRRRRRLTQMIPVPHYWGWYGSAMRRIALFFDLARGRSALFSISEPVLGAMLALGAIPPLPTCLLGVLAALAGYLCVYSLNDLMDLRADREEIRVSTSDPLAWQPQVAHMDVVTLRHPVAAGALPVWAAVTFVAVLGLVGLAAAYILRPLCAYLFIGCAGLEIIYCSMRRRTWLKVVPAATMVAVGGLAGWFAVGRATWGALAFFFLLFGWEMGRNLTNDLADVVHDRLVGITTLASTHGPTVAARVILADGIAMVPLSLVQPVAWVVRGLLAGVALLTMTLPALVLFHNPDEPSAQRYFNRLTFFPPFGAACAIIVAAVAYIA